MGELDQALFLYLEGQDHSSAQDQRREYSFSPFFICVLSFVFQRERERERERERDLKKQLTDGFQRALSVAFLTGAFVL